MYQRDNTGRGGRNNPPWSRVALPHHAIGLTLEQKSPDGLLALRVGERMRNLAMSATVATVIVMAPTALAAVVPLAAIIVTPHVTRIHVYHRTVGRRCVNHWRRDRPIRYGGRTSHDGRQTRWRSHHHSCRERDRHPEREVQRPTRLRRGGEPSESNCGNQTEDIFCLHERFDGVFRWFFN
jgi:hypothetical protein